VNGLESGLLPLCLGSVKAFLLSGTGKRVLIDTGTAGNSARLVGQLERSGVDATDVDLTVVTHAHFDHIGNLADVVQATGAKVIAHRLEAGSVRTTGAESDILVGDKLNLDPYGVAGRVIWTPGHTRGSLSVILESGEAVVGDLVLPRFMAFGPPAIAFWAASREDTLASVRRVLDLKSSIILTSHGGPYRPEDLAGLAR